MTKPGTAQNTGNSREIDNEDTVTISGLNPYACVRVCSMENVDEGRSKDAREWECISNRTRGHRELHDPVDEFYRYCSMHYKAPFSHSRPSHQCPRGGLELLAWYRASASATFCNDIACSTLASAAVFASTDASLEFSSATSVSSCRMRDLGRVQSGQEYVEGIHHNRNERRWHHDVVHTELTNR